MKKVLLFLMVLMSFMLFSCAKESEETPMTHTQQVSDVAEVLGVELTDDVENVIKMLIYQNTDFNWWADLNGYSPLDEFPIDTIFTLFLAWSGLPEDQKRQPKEDETPITGDPYFWDNPPAVIYNDGYWTAWNLNYDYYIHHTNYIYTFVQQDGTSRYTGAHPNGALWDEYGIPIPVDKTAFNNWFTESYAWAVQYYLDHFTGENADYQLPPTP